MKSYLSENLDTSVRSPVAKHFTQALVIVIIASTIAVAYPWLLKTVGPLTKSLHIIYIFLSAWFWGVRGGVSAAIVAILIGFSRSRGLDVSGIPTFPQGATVTLMLGLFAGKLRDLSWQLQKELREKEKSEKKLEDYRDQLEEMVEMRTAELKESFVEIERLKDQLVTENIYLRREINLDYKYEEIIGESKAIKQVLAQVEEVAGTDATVLVLGETGTGKELLARGIHNLSPRKNRTLVKVNCAALPPSLIESELFGREKGAFTGATSTQVGRFEIADGSSIFLDEIGELPLELQAKLLHVVQEGQFERLGSSKTITVDVRIIAATNRDLAKAVRDGKFRQDFYYRLNVFPIVAPPLRDRKEDIPLLVGFFVNEFAKRMGKQIETISQKAMEALQHYPWDGNIRELMNVIEQAVIKSKDKTLNIQMPAVSGSKILQDQTLEDVERNHIIKTLERTGWRVRGKNGAAEILRIKPTTLDARMKKLGIKRPEGTDKAKRYI